MRIEQAILIDLPDANGEDRLGYPGRRGVLIPSSGTSVIPGGPNSRPGAGCRPSLQPIASPLT